MSNTIYACTSQELESYKPIKVILSVIIDISRTPCDLAEGYEILSQQLISVLGILKAELTAEDEEMFFIILANAAEHKGIQVKEIDIIEIEKEAQ
jgi:hypothetical protein